MDTTHLGSINKNNLLAKDKIHQWMTLVWQFSDSLEQKEGH